MHTQEGEVMDESTGKQHVVRELLAASVKSIDHHRRIQDSYVRSAVALGVPVAEIAEITGRTVANVERISSE